MAGPEYLVPFGIDATPFLKGISDMEAGTDELVAEVETANKEIQQSFNKTGAAASAYGEEVKKIFAGPQSLALLTDKVRNLQAQLFTERDRGKIALYKKEIAEVNKEIQKIGNIGKAGFNEMGVKIVQQQGYLERLKAAADAYRVSIQKATEPSQLAAYNKGLQGITDEINRLQNAGTKGFDALGNSLKKTAGSANVLSKGFGFIRQAAYLIPGIGIAGIFNVIGEAVVDLVQNLNSAGDGFDTIAEKVKVLTEVNAAANKEAATQLVDLRLLYEATQDSTRSLEERTAAAKTLQAEFPETFANIQYETILNGNAAVAYDTLTTSILANARAKAAKNKLDELAAQRLDIEFQKTKIRNASNQNINAVPVRGVSDVDAEGVAITTFTQDEERNRLRRFRDAALAEEDIKDKRLRDQEDFLVKFAGGEKALTKVVTDEHKKEVEEMEKKAADEEKARAKAAEKLKKDGEKLTKAAQIEADKQKKLQEQQLKAFNDLMAKFSSQEADLSAKSITEAREQALAVSDAKFQKIINDANKAVTDANVNDKQRIELRKQANKVIEEAELASAQARIEINEKFNAEQLKITEAANRALGQIGDTRQVQEINRVNEHYAQLTEAVRRGGLLTVENAAAIEESRQRTIDEINIKFGQEQINKNTALGIATVKVSEEYAKKSVATEKAKQLAILDVSLKGAEAQLKLLTDNHKTENDIEVKNAQETIDNIKQQIKNTQNNNGKGQSLFEFLGLDPKGQQDLKMYGNAAREAGQITAEFFGELAEAQQMQIDAKQALIDQDNEAIDELENQLNKEMDLRDKGLANNVDTLQKELAAKKAQRDEDLKNQQEIQRKQNALKKAQIIADSISQVSNLITAASEIFEAFSSIPIVGVPLAIAAVGLMLGSFAAAKVNAFKAVGKNQSFGAGGIVDGKSHSQGGKKYISADGSGNVVELEGGEHVTNKKSTRKYATLLDAINNDDLGGMNDDALRELLAGTGIGLSAESPKAGVKIARERNDYKSAANNSQPGNDISKDIKNINENVGYLASRERERPETWEDEKYFYYKKGTKTTKVLK